MFIKKLNLFFMILATLFTAGIITGESSAQPDGEFAIRTGVNVSHWLSQSGKRGEARKNYITRADFDTIASGGFDHVRIPLDEEHLWDESGNKEQDAFELLHNAIQWAADAGLKVIADLHIIRSHYFNAESNALWTDEREQQKLVEMWIELSEELKKYPNEIVAYEILNEAVADNPEDWNKLIAKVMKALRAREPERIIVIGSNRWQIPDTFPDLKLPENDKNIILSFHFYTPMALTHHKASWVPFADYNGKVNYPGQIIDTANYEGLSEPALEALRNYANGYFDKEKLEEIMLPAIKAAKESGLQLYCGEFGVYPTIPEEISYRWYKDVTGIFNENNIAYCHWGYKGDFPVVDKNSTLNRELVSILTAK